MTNREHAGGHRHGGTHRALSVHRMAVGSGRLLAEDIVVPGVGCFGLCLVLLVQMTCPDT